MSFFITLMVALALVACGDDTSAGADAGQGRDGGGDGDGDGGDGDGDGDATPIVARASDGTFTCRVGQPLRGYDQTVWSYTGSDLVALSGGTTWLVRVEASAPDPFTPGPYELVASMVDETGDLLSTTRIPVDNVDFVRASHAVALSDGTLGVFWTENAVLRFVAIDEEGVIAIEPKTIASGNGLGETNRLRVVVSETGSVAALWNDTDNVVHVAVTDETGAAAEPSALTRKAMPTPIIQPASDGQLVVLWRSFDPDFVEPSEVFFSLLDSAGHEAGAAVQLTHASGENFFGFFGGTDLAIHPVADGYLLAWTEGENGDFETGTGAYSVVRVQRVSSQGEPQGASVLVDAKADSIDQTEPAFVPWGDALALLWGRGTHIYVCGGCVPDHSVNLVLIDPDTLAPRSNVAQVTPTAGGLINRSLARSGETDLLMKVEVQFHTNFEPGFAAFHCEP